MKYPICLGLATVAILVCGVAGAQELRDVPADHWARAAVAAVTSRGVMAAPGGKFDGERKVTRTELAITLANMARALEKGSWPKEKAVTLSSTKAGAAAMGRPVTRYELAVVLDKVARNVMQGLPKPTGKVYGNTEALPEVTLKGVAASDPAYASLTYLVKNHMVWGDSVILKPGPQPVTGAQVADAVTMMVAGLTDRLTDEPQNREDLGAPPGKKSH